MADPFADRIEASLAALSRGDSAAYDDKQKILGGNLSRLVKR